MNHIRFSPQLYLKLFSVTFLLLGHYWAQAMEERNQLTYSTMMRWGPEEFHFFESLMPELQDMILSCVVDICESQGEATQTIQAVTLVNKKCYGLVNSTNFTRNFIKKSQEKFRTTDLRMLLATKSGQQLFDELIRALQTYLKYTIMLQKDEAYHKIRTRALTSKDNDRLASYLMRQLKNDTFINDQYNIFVNQKSHTISSYADFHFALDTATKNLYLLNNIKRIVLQRAILTNKTVGTQSKALNPERKISSTRLLIRQQKIQKKRSQEKNTQEFQTKLIPLLISDNIYTDGLYLLAMIELQLQDPLPNEYKQEAESLFTYTGPTS